MNLFDLSPRELTNSAVWMWFLSGLTMPRGSIRHKIATGILRDLNVPVPESVQLLRTEYALPDGRRIDILLEGQILGQPYIFFIENKVSGDTGIDQQVRGYIDALKDRNVPVYSAVFSLYHGITNQIEQSQLFDSKIRPHRSRPTMESGPLHMETGTGQQGRARYSGITVDDLLVRSFHI